jgi:hypothetical protein
MRRDNKTNGGEPMIDKDLITIIALAFSFISATGVIGFVWTRQGKRLDRRLDDMQKINDERYRERLQTEMTLCNLRIDCPALAVETADFIIKEFKANGDLKTKRDQMVKTMDDYHRIMVANAAAQEAKFRQSK